MSSSENGSATPSGNPPPQSQSAARGFWALLGNAAGVGAVLGLIGTVFVAVFQYISAYHNSVANLAKNDLDKAMSALTDTVSTLSRPLSLQERLIWDYYLAQRNTHAGDAVAYRVGANSISDDYQKSFNTLSASTALLARKMEIYLDLPDDLSHVASNSAAKTAPINNSNLKTAPINTSNLHTSDFNCDDDKYMPMPAFGIDGAADQSQLVLTPKTENGEKPAIENGGSETLIVNWNSAKDNLVTLEYCLENTHYKIGRIINWASKGTDDKLADDIEKLKNRSKSQGRRFNDFMSVATFKIEQFRVRYQPNGLVCSILGTETVFDRFTHCTPLHIATKSPIANH
jgi:hypothetical protein